MPSDRSLTPFEGHAGWLLVTVPLDANPSNAPEYSDLDDPRESDRGLPGLSLLSTFGSPSLSARRRLSLPLSFPPTPPVLDPVIFP